MPRRRKLAKTLRCMGRQFPLNPKVWRAMEQQAKENKKWAENHEFADNPDAWPASGMSQKMLKERLRKSVRELAEHSYCYLYWRAHAQTNIGALDPADRRKWEKLTGEPIPPEDYLGKGKRSSHRREHLLPILTDKESAGRGQKMRFLPDGKIQIDEGEPFDPKQSDRAVAARKALRKRWSKPVQEWLEYEADADSFSAKLAWHRVWKLADDAPKYEIFEALKLIDPLQWKHSRSQYKGASRQAASADAQRDMIAQLSKMKATESIDPAGLAREADTTSLNADYFLQSLVKKGLAEKDGKWYSIPNPTALLKLGSKRQAGSKRPDFTIFLDSFFVSIERDSFEHGEIGGGKSGEILHGGDLKFKSARDFIAWVNREFGLKPDLDAWTAFEPGRIDVQWSAYDDGTPVTDKRDFEAFKRGEIDLYNADLHLYVRFGKLWTPEEDEIAKLFGISTY